MPKSIMAGPQPRTVDQGSGAFSQPVDRYRTRVVGTIPAGKTNVSVSLDAESGADIDIQLFAGREKIVAWDLYGEHGILSGPTQQTIEDWNGLRITYSGYNGRNNNRLLRTSQSLEPLPVNLTVKVFGCGRLRRCELLLGQRCYWGHLWGADSGPISSLLGWDSNVLHQTMASRSTRPVRASKKPTVRLQRRFPAIVFPSPWDLRPVIGPARKTLVFRFCQGPRSRASFCGGIAAIACGTDLSLDFVHRVASPTKAVNVLK